MGRCYPRGNIGFGGWREEELQKKITARLPNCCWLVGGKANNPRGNSAFRQTVPCGGRRKGGRSAGSSNRDLLATGCEAKRKTTTKKTSLLFSRRRKKNNKEMSSRFCLHRSTCLRTRGAPWKKRKVPEQRGPSPVPPGPPGSAPATGAKPRATAVRAPAPRPAGFPPSHWTRTPPEGQSPRGAAAGAPPRGGPPCPAGPEAGRCPARRDADRRGRSPAGEEVKQRVLLLSVRRHGRAAPLPGAAGA